MSQILNNVSGSKSADNEGKPLYAWGIAKKSMALVLLVLLAEFIYFLQTATSSFEITVNCILIFTVILNIPILYSLYKTNR